jgi:hypothetical protein
MTTNFVDSKDPIDGKTKLLELMDSTSVSDPVSIRAASEKTGAFKGDSQYDRDLIYGVDQNYLRARNQPWYDELANAAAKTIPGIALGLVENTGYIGDLLFDWDDRDYSNSFTEAAKEARARLDENLPVLQTNPNDVFSLGDTAWWFTHAQGLAESIGEFAITGAVAGMGLSKAARGVAKLVGNGAKANAITQGTAQLMTASGLAFTEGAMSGNEIYKATYTAALADGLSDVKARAKASDAAAHTVRLNTIINTGLNISSVNALFKTFEKAKIRGLLSKGKTEEMPDFLKRLDVLEKQGIKEASATSAYLREALQEGIEEDVNLWAEGEGKIRGGLQKEEGTAFDRFIKSSTTQEGVLNFILGAAGGLGQTLAMGKVPYRTYTDPETGKTKRVNNDFLEKVQTNDAFKKQLVNVRDDFNRFFQGQKNLTTALESKNPEIIKQAKEMLFDVSAYKSIRDDNSDLLINELQNIASTDNFNIGTDGKTEAQRKGYTESVNDNEYKEIAAKKISELQILQKEYNNLVPKFETKRGADKAFEQYLQVHRKTSQANNIQLDINQKIANYSQLASNPNLVSAIDYEAYLDGIDNAIKNTTDPKAKSSLESTRRLKQAEYDNLKNDKAIETKGLKDNQGLIDELAKDYSNYFVTHEESKAAKVDYNKILSNPKKFEEDQIKKDIKEVVEPIIEQNKKENTQATKQEQAEGVKKEVVKDDMKSKLQFENPNDIFSDINKDQLSKIADLLKAQIRGKQKLTPEMETVINQYPEFAGRVKALIEKLDAGTMTFDLSEEEQELAEAYNLINQGSSSTKQLEGINSSSGNEYHGGADSKEAQGSVDSGYGYSSYNRKHNEIVYKSRETTETKDANGNILYDKEAADTPITDSVQILHSNSFGIGTEIELRVEQTSDNTKKVDIEKRRQEELESEGYRIEIARESRKWIDENGINFETIIITLKDGHKDVIVKNLDNNNQTARHSYPKELSNEKIYEVESGNKVSEESNIQLKPTESKIISKINAKYDAELAILNTLDVDNYRTEILHNGVKIGYLPQVKYVAESQQESLRAVRRYLLAAGSVKTTINDKRIGKLNNNTTKNSNSIDAFPVIDSVDFAIGKDGKLWISNELQYNNEIVDTTINNGFVYVVVNTPNGKKFAIPVDINKASEQIANAIANATKIFTNRNSLTDEQRSQLANFPYNITDAIGFREYVESLLPHTDLRDTTKNTGKTKGYYLQTTNNGISWMKGEGVKSKVYSIAPNSPDGFYIELVKHIQNMYVRTDMDKIKSNKAVNIPQVKIDGDKVVIEDLIRHDNYKDYLANNTNTNVLGIKLNTGEMTVFIHPFMTYDTSFLKEQDKKISEYKTESGQKVILATENKKFPSRTLAVGQNQSVDDPKRVTDEDAAKTEKECQK